MYDIQDALYIQISGNINPDSAAQFTEDVNEKLKNVSQSLIVFDLRDLIGINSQILGIIVRVWQDAKKNGKTVRVLARKRVIELFRIARVESIIEIYTLEDIPSELSDS